MNTSNPGSAINNPVTPKSAAQIIGPRVLDLLAKKAKSLSGDALDRWQAILADVAMSNALIDIAGLLPNTDPPGQVPKNPGAVADGSMTLTDEERKRAVQLGLTDAQAISAKRERIVNGGRILP